MANFFKKLFGGQNGRVHDRDGMYFYVQPKRCKEIIRVRVNMNNDLSLDDDGGYFCRKVVTAVRCPFQAELHLWFDRNRNLTNSEVINGQLVSEVDYEAYITAQNAPSDN
ncbi:MAG: hypothetical protein CUN56_15695 [Phototrophicales bacterium]|nr:MAG: hypothetical protein CUN56_15695 [Phototrophicales bacterium]RMG81289.1 MAG: hypothetical protein D6712_16605 [Chloroflexota bacterium]